MNWELFNEIVNSDIIKGDFDKALDFYKEYNISDGNLVDVYWNIGDIYFWCCPEYILCMIGEVKK